MTKKDIEAMEEWASNFKEYLCDDALGHPIYITEPTIEDVCDWMADHKDAQHKAEIADLLLINEKMKEAADVAIADRVRTQSEQHKAEMDKALELLREIVIPYIDPVDEDILAPVEAFIKEHSDER